MLIISQHTIFFPKRSVSENIIVPIKATSDHYFVYRRLFIWKSFSHFLASCLSKENTRISGQLVRWYQYWCDADRNWSGINRKILLRSLWVIHFSLSSNWVPVISQTMRDVLGVLLCIFLSYLFYLVPPPNCQVH